MTQQHLYIIRGVPGSGKTTLAAKMLDRAMIDSFYEADDHMVDDSGNYRFDPSRLKHCHNECQRSVRHALRNEWSVAVSNTFTRKWEMQPYLDMAEELGIQVTVLVCQGEFDNVHGVPADKVRVMRERFEW